MNLAMPIYHQFLQELKARIRKAQYEALKAVNHRQMELYWYIGEQIAQKQSELGWGRSVVEQLSSDIQKEFPGIRGFSPSNLWRMRNWVMTYSGKEKLAPMVREIGWSHNLAIMEKCKTDQQREQTTHRSFNLPDCPRTSSRLAKVSSYTRTINQTHPTHRCPKAE